MFITFTTADFDNGVSSEVQLCFCCVFRSVFHGTSHQQPVLSDALSKIWCIFCYPANVLDQASAQHCNAAYRC